MRFATIMSGAVLALAACSSAPTSRGEPVPIGHDCGGWTQADEHMATFGCPPCPCGASCPPCDKFGGERTEGAGEGEVEPAEEAPPTEGASCPGFKEPTPEEIEEHIATFGCAPCKCSCVDGEVKCAPCPPCQPPPRLDGSDAVGAE